MADENVNHSSRQTRSAEPYRLPSDLVASTDNADLDSILGSIRSATEIELELSFKSLDGQLTNADRVIGNIAALKNINGDPTAKLLELAQGNFTE